MPLVTLTGRGTHKKEYRTTNYKLVVGQVLDVPERELARWMADYPHDFEVIGGTLGANLIESARVDLGRLRAPGSPVVGAIVTTYNGLAHTARLMLSLAPVEGVDLRVVVVDNCSTDGTVEWLTRNGITYVQPVARCPVAEALNAGVLALRPHRPRYILVLNNDVSLPAGYVDRLVRYLDAHPECGWVVGVHRSRYVPNAGPVDLEGEHLTGDSSATLLRADMLDEIGGWDERFQPRYGEDEDLLTRVRLAEYRAVRLAEPYDGDEGGYATSNRWEEQQIESYRRALTQYRGKWGDYPISAARARASLPDVIGTAPCMGLAITEPPPPPLRRSRDEFAIIQNGHIGDVLLTFPIARELQDLGNVTWYAVEPYLSIAKLCPGVREFVDTERVSGSLPKPHAFEAASAVARADADALGLRPVEAQIAPGSLSEYLVSPLPYVRFMHARCGVFPRSARPSLIEEPPEVQVERERVVARAGVPPEAVRVLLNLRSESAPCRIDWAYWDAFASRLRSVLPASALVYSEHADYPWRGKVPARKLERFEDVRCVAYMAASFDLVITTSTAPLWSAFAHDVPTICLLPREQVGPIPENEVLRKNSMQLNGLQREWQVMDAVIGRRGAVERFTAEELALVVRDHVRDGADLRGIHAERYGDLFRAS